MEIIGPFRHDAHQAPIAIDDYAGRLVAQYDKNGDGKLSSWERLRSTYPEFLPRPEHHHAGSMQPTQPTTSIARLAVLADKLGKADGVTEAWEIEGVMRLFDTGDTHASIFRDLFGGSTTHDGMLSGSERENSFEETVGPEDVNFPHVRFDDFDREELAPDSDLRDPRDAILR